MEICCVTPCLNRKHHVSVALARRQRSRHTEATVHTGSVLSARFKALSSKGAARLWCYALRYSRRRYAPIYVGLRSAIKSEKKKSSQTFCGVCRWVWIILWCLLLAIIKWANGYGITNRSRVCCYLALSRERERKRERKREGEKVNVCTAQTEQSGSSPGPIRFVHMSSCSVSRIWFAVSLNTPNQ